MMSGVLLNPTNMKPSYMVATGGTVSYYEDAGTVYAVHKFTSSGTFDVISGGGASNVLLVAGGGGGGHDFGAGGGGGGLIETTASVSTSGYSVTVGAGGAGSTGNLVAAVKGGDSTGFGLTAVGGGAGNNGSGSYTASTVENGGSGGGGGGYSATSNAANGTGTSGQGYAGGTGYGGSGDTTSAAGGGGGAGQVGANGVANDPGNGGNGIQSSISGTATYYAGGGGGGTYTSGSNSVGGLGGGGIGKAGTGQSGDAGTNGLGGGGGGCSGGGAGTGGNGGSGVVIVNYPAKPSGLYGAEYSFSNVTNNPTGGSTFTFTGVNIGSAADGILAVFAGVEVNATSWTNPIITNITLDAASGTNHATTNSLWTGARLDTFGSPAGSTGTIVVTVDVTCLRAGLWICRIPTTTETPASVLSDSELNPNTPSVAFTGVAAGSVGLFYDMMSFGANAGTVVWTNATEVFDETAGAAGSAHSGAHIANFAGGNVTVTPTPTTSEYTSLIGAFWS